MNKHSGLAQQIEPIPCPCCGQEVRMPSLDMVSYTFGLTTQQTAIFEAVWKGRGLPVPTQRIFDAMYRDDPDGGPRLATMYEVFKVSLFKLRKRLEGSPFSVVNEGHGRGYRLVIRAREQG